MSGHSKLANIKHKKEKNDAAKGKIFTIIGREIAIAVKEQLGYDLDKKKIQIKEAIRTPGMHLVPVKLHQKVTAELKVHVGEA